MNYVRRYIFLINNDENKNVAKSNKFYNFLNFLLFFYQNDD